MVVLVVTGQGGRVSVGGDFERMGQQSGVIGRGRGRVPRFCTYCKGTNHTIDRCWQLNGHPSARQVTVSVYDEIQFTG